MEINLNYSFLEELLSAVAPSGSEDAAAKLWVREAETFADRVERDAYGNVYATIDPGSAPPLVLAGHLDEIGVIVPHIDEDGYVYFRPLGGWNPQVLVGQRIRFGTADKTVIGVVGHRHSDDPDQDQRDQRLRMSDLWIDIGASARKTAGQHLQVGTVGVIEQPPVYLLEDCLASRALDNRLGAFVVLEALRHISQADIQTHVTAIASVQEEIGAYGARMAAHHVKPDTAIVVDVTYCAKQPGVDKKTYGNVMLGSGVNLAVGPMMHRQLLAQLRTLADEYDVPYTLSAFPDQTDTDADVIMPLGEGIPTALLSIPCRYVHSPSEMVALHDVEATGRLLCLYALNPLCRLGIQ